LVDVLGAQRYPLKKEAQIKIQAVAKIQYPIKSHSSNANHGPLGC
jgi:hypothetical protein